MPSNALIDTNILIYAYDVQDRTRQAKAIEVLRNLQAAHAGFLSVKCLSEFFVVVRRIPNPLSTDEALREMQRLRAVWPVLDLTADIAVEAARAVQTYQFSYWDAQMWATAKAHNLSAVFSEDMRVGSVIERVAIINPLSPEFDLSNWLKG
jgi:predicted nucleic acid-binding protein